MSVHVCCWPKSPMNTGTHGSWRRMLLRVASQMCRGKHGGLNFMTYSSNLLMIPSFSSCLMQMQSQVSKTMHMLDRMTCSLQNRLRTSGISWAHGSLCYHVLFPAMWVPDGASQHCIDHVCIPLCHHHPSSLLQFLTYFGGARPWQWTLWSLCNSSASRMDTHDASAPAQAGLFEGAAECNFAWGSPTLVARFCRTWMETRHSDACEHAQCPTSWLVFIEPARSSLRNLKRASSQKRFGSLDRINCRVEKHEARRVRWPTWTWHSFSAVWCSPSVLEIEARYFTTTCVCGASQESAETGASAGYPERSDADLRAGWCCWHSSDDQKTL